MKKIAFFLPSLRGGGAERVMVTLASQFCKQGYSVDLILGKKEGPYLSEVDSAVRVIDLNTSRIAFTLFGLVSYLRKERPIALLSTMKHANVVAILAAKFSCTGVRVVVREANTLAASISNSKTNTERLMPIFMKVFYKFAHKVVAVSNGVKKDLVEFVGVEESRIEVIYSPVVTSDLVTKSEVEITHEWFNENSPPVVVTAGRLTEQKDFESLIEAFNLVRETMPLRLFIMGEGKLRKCLEDVVSESHFSDDIYLAGFIDNPFPYIKNADVFVLSSLWEGLPNGLIQALALGVPVISTDCPSGPSEILESGKWGRLVPVSDIAAMSKAITQQLQYPAHLDGEDVMDYCNARFGVCSVAEAYEKALLGE